MKQVEYFEIQAKQMLFIKYKDGSFTQIDLCALFGLEMVEEEREKQK